MRSGLQWFHTAPAIYLPTLASKELSRQARRAVRFTNFRYGVVHDPFLPSPHIYMPPIPQLLPSIWHFWSPSQFQTSFAILLVIFTTVRIPGPLRVCPEDGPSLLGCFRYLQPDDTSESIFSAGSESFGHDWAYLSCEWSGP